MAETIANIFWGLFYAACFAAALHVGWLQLRDEGRRTDVSRRGVDLEAEVLGRYEAGEAEGKSLVKGRQVLMAPWDPLELELRYVFDGREIVSRGRVSQKTFFRTRGMKTVPIRVLREKPESWAAMV
ncbi:MAG TPA: hypothetical protein VIJ02_08450 [Thermoanaerobaculia bacterium]